MEQQDIVSDSMLYLVSETKGWLRFLGIVSIISGVISFLSIFGIFIAWLPLWQGFLLLNSANKADRYVQEKNEIQLRETLKPIKTYFVIQSIVVGLSIIFSIVAVIFIFATGFGLKSGLSSFFQQ